MSAVAVGNRPGERPRTNERCVLSSWQRGDLKEGSAPASQRVRPASAPSLLSDLVSNGGVAGENVPGGGCIHDWTGHPDFADLLTLAVDAEPLIEDWQAAQREIHDHIAQGHIHRYDATLDTLIGEESWREGRGGGGGAWV